MTSLLQRDWIMAALASAHLTLFAAFGLWLWFTIHEFGLNRECEPFTYLSFIVGTLPVISPTLRIFSIIIYLICLLPIVNIVVFGGMEVAVIYGFQRLVAYFRHRQGSPSPLLASQYVLYQFIFLALLVQVYFTASTELTIKYNGHQLTQNQEGEGTFGQTLAAALTIIPLIQVAQEIWDNLVRWLEGDQ